MVCPTARRRASGPCGRPSGRTASTQTAAAARLPAATGTVRGEMPPCHAKKATAGNRAATAPRYRAGPNGPAAFSSFEASAVREATYAVHPAATGYRQIGDSFYFWIRNTLR